VTAAAAKSSLERLHGVGHALAERFHALDIDSPAALARVLPRDYKDWRTPVRIAEIVRDAIARHGAAESADSEETIAVGELTNAREIRARVAIVTGDLTDGSGRLKLTWFGRRGLKLNAGDRLFVHGRAQVKFVRGAPTVELNVLQHKVLEPEEAYRGAVVPVYRASKDLPSRTIAKVIDTNLEELVPYVRPLVPEALATSRGFGDLLEAWRRVHRPASPEEAVAARERLIYEEFFGIALRATYERARRRAAGGAPALTADANLLVAFEDALGFRFTNAQRRAIHEIYGDMAHDAPMNRLLQGDVGSGKTLVAASAVLLAARAGFQSALMAPTEILASQHAAKLAPLLLPFGIRTEALFGSLGARDRERVRGRLESGEAELVVGTHALIEDDVVFKRLGLAIVDEQHRFGVRQRAKLRSKSRAPHTLYMTATPIPRTLAQTKYADLDLTTIDELPPGRTPIETFVLRESRKSLAYEFVRKNVAQGRQAYVVVPAIDESEDARSSAVAELELLRREVFPTLRVGLLHGRLTPREKDAAMSSFARGEIDVLLATTVVEVGVDVPNASVMVILDADRFGLAQLHQLRGRVGRGVARSYCILIAPEGRDGIRRLDVLAATTDGFAIAEEDLKLRSEGDLTGSAQAGLTTLIGDIGRDFAIYAMAKADAESLIAADAGLRLEAHGALRRFVDDDAPDASIFLSS